ncbi:MAG: DUF4160 domain-containing protein [bacterium]
MIGRVRQYDYVAGCFTSPDVLWENTINPTISSLYGIIVNMFYDEHNPPHFHAKYAEYNIVVEIESLKILEGALPARALGLLYEWATIHKEELKVAWENARLGMKLEKNQPL